MAHLIIQDGNGTTSLYMQTKQSLASQRLLRPPSLAQSHSRNVLKLTKKIHKSKLREACLNVSPNHATTSAYDESSESVPTSGRRNFLREILQTIYEFGSFRTSVSPLCQGPTPTRLIDDREKPRTHRAHPKRYRVGVSRLQCNKRKPPQSLECQN